MTEQIERRDFVQGVGLVAGIAAASTLIQHPAHAQTAPPPGAKPMSSEIKPFEIKSYDIKPLSLDPKSVKGIRKKFSSVIMRTITPAR